jgi:hypothetical protein
LPGDVRGADDYRSEVAFGLDAGLDLAVHQG